MVLKKKKYQIEGKKPVMVLSLLSSCISFVGMFFGLLPITMNTKEKKAEFIASLVSDSVDELTAERMFSIFNGAFTYLLIISIMILVMSTILLFLMSWILHKENKRKIGLFIYAFSIVHLFSFRVIESILFYRQAIKFLTGEEPKKKNKK